MWRVKTTAAPDPSTRKPKFKPPPLACDAHCHVFGPSDRFPYAPDAPYWPPDAPVEALQKLHAVLGLERAVIVHASCHGADMRVTLDAIARSGGRYRGTAIIDPTYGDKEFTQMNDGGIRAVRFNFVQHLGGRPDMNFFDRTVARLKGVAPDPAPRFEGPGGVPAQVRVDSGADGDRPHGAREGSGRPGAGAIQAAAGLHAERKLLGEGLRRRARVVQRAAV
jgi:hypothetical protein